MAKKKIQEKTKESLIRAKQRPVSARGRTFQGVIVKKFSTRVAVEFERPVYMRKYERFYKKITRIHARLPEGIDVSVGDRVKIRECRPLSKIIHHIVVSKLSKSKEDKK